MKYNLLKDIIGLMEDFEQEAEKNTLYPRSKEGFIQWLLDNNSTFTLYEPYWEGKEKGRSPESAINTLLVQLNRYAKSYSKSAISGSAFSTQEEFIYLINLRTFGAMTKMQLIQRNVHEKPSGIQIINRLIQQGWVSQTDSEVDKRSKVITITEAGVLAIENQMDKIRQATMIVTGNLNLKEKLELIHLLNKLENFHQPIYQKNVDPTQLLDVAYKEYIRNTE